MEDLAKADFRTIKTFITNNITAERLLVDILHQSVTEKSQTDKESCMVEDAAADEAEQDCDQRVSSEFNKRVITTTDDNSIADDDSVVNSKLKPSEK